MNVQIVAAEKLSQCCPVSLPHIYHTNTTPIPHTSNQNIQLESDPIRSKINRYQFNLKLMISVDLFSAPNSDGVYFQTEIDGIYSLLCITCDPFWFPSGRKPSYLLRLLCGKITCLAEWVIQPTLFRYPYKSNVRILIE